MMIRRAALNRKIFIAVSCVVSCQEGGTEISA
ncbi:hypothetical protein J2129_000599 [Methanofollis sp. W23]|nr:hypothetical protein [Methanofollis sp. W23]